MMTYITAFIFYTMAMVGILLVGFIVYKKTLTTSKGENKGMIKILDSYMIAPKKMLFVVKVKDEKFLIASGIEHTTFLAKLSDSEAKNNEYNTDNFILQKQNQNVENLINNQEKQYEDLQKARLNKIQKQFNELYSKDSTIQTTTQPERQTLDRRQMVKALLKDLNETTNAKMGSMF